MQLILKSINTLLNILGKKVARHDSYVAPKMKMKILLLICLFFCSQAVSSEPTYSTSSHGKTTEQTKGKCSHNYTHVLTSIISLCRKYVSITPTPVFIFKPSIKNAFTLSIQSGYRTENFIKYYKFCLCLKIVCTTPPSACIIAIDQ